MYDFTEEQYMLKDMVKKFAEIDVKPYVEEIDETGIIPAHLIDKVKELGLWGMPYPEEYGGGGCSLLDSCIYLEEISKVDCNIGMYSCAHELGMMPLLIAGSEELKRKYVPRVASGEWYCCFGLTEADAGSDAAGIKTTAVDMGDHWLINGSKHFISMADEGDLISLFCKTDPDKGVRGISCIMTELKQPGVTIGKHENKMGFRAVHACEIFFDNVKVPKENLVGELNKGFKYAMITLDKTRPLVGAMGVGLAQGALDFAIEYTKERYQFGKPVVANQGLQWMMCDMAIQIEAARQLAFKAACLTDQAHPDAAKLGCMSKVFGTDTAMKCCTEGIQVCGGAGYMKEYPQEKRFRDAKLLQIVEGTNQIQRVVIGTHLFGKL